MEVLNMLMEIISESILTIVGALAAALLAYLAPKAKQFKQNIDKTLDNKNLGIIKEMVDHGVELAEKELTGASGEDKFNRAYEYASTMVNRYDIIDLSPDFLKGAVQNGYRRMEQRKKGDDK